MGHDLLDRVVNPGGNSALRAATPARLSRVFAPQRSHTQGWLACANRAESNLLVLPQRRRMKIDKLQAELYYPLDGDWTYPNQHISLAGFKLLSRILGVKLTSSKFHIKNGVSVATVKARYKSVQSSGTHTISPQEKGSGAKAIQLASRNAVMKVIPSEYQTLFINSRKVYFAHSISTYGSKREQFARSQIKAQGGENWMLIDPSVVVKKTSGAEAMRESFGIIERCDALVFTAQLSYLSKGVFEEVMFALNHSIPVSYLNRAEFKRIEDKRYFELVNHGDNWEQYAKIEF